MSAPRVDQVNVVLTDLAAATQFLGELGFELPPAPPRWEAHHRALPAASEFEIELDSAVFAQEWGGLPPSFNGVVLNLRVDERAEVDALHERAVALGGRSLRAPHDAFWGSRFAVVEGPGPIVLGLLSPRDIEHAGEPPDPTTLA